MITPSLYHGDHQLTFPLLGRAVAEIERSLIIERVRPGMPRARIEGLRLGRPKVAVDLDALL